MRRRRTSGRIRLPQVLFLRRVTLSANQILKKEWREMSVRAYMLLDIVDRSCEYAVQMLRRRAEVILADRLEGYPNIIVMVEAADRQGLAEAIIPVLGCIDGITENLTLLVTRAHGTNAGDERRRCQCANRGQWLEEKLQGEERLG